MSKRLVSQRLEDNRFASSSRKVKLEESQVPLQFEDEVDGEESHSGQRKRVVLIKQETSSKQQEENADTCTEKGVIGLRSRDASEDQFQNASKTSSNEAFVSKSTSAPKIQVNERCLLLQTVKKGQEIRSKTPAEQQTPDTRKKVVQQEVYYVDKTLESSTQLDGMEAMGSIKGLEILALNQRDDRCVGLRSEILTAEESNERRVQARVANSNSVFQSLLTREYTEESTGARTIRQSGGKDRHSKVVTSKGPRDRRVRLSVSTAIQFYDVQDRLGYDQPSKAVEWLIKKAKTSIDELQHLPELGFQSLGADQPGVHASRILEPISGPFGPGSSCTDSFSCCSKGCGGSKCTGLSVNSATTMNEEVDIEMVTESAKQCNKKQGEDQLEEVPIIEGAPISSAIPEDIDMDCSSVLGSETRAKARSPGDMAEQARQRREEKKTQKVSDILKWYVGKAVPNHGSSDTSTSLQYTQDTSSCGLFNALNSYGAPASDGFFRPDHKPLRQTVTLSSTFHSLDALEKSALMQNLYESTTPSLLLQNTAASVISKAMVHDQFDHSSSIQLPWAPSVATSSSEMQPFEDTFPNNFLLQAHFQPSYPVMQQLISSHADDDVLTNTAPTLPSVFPVHDSNSFSAAATSFRPLSAHLPSPRPSHDEINSNIAVLQSLRILSPELCDFGYPSNGYGLAGEASKFTPVHQGYLLCPMLAASLLNQDEDLAHGPAYVEDVFSIRPPLTDASEGSLSVSSLSVTSSTAASLQSIYFNPALSASPTDAGYSLGSVKGTEMIPTGSCTSYSSFLTPNSRIPARIQGFDDFEADQETVT